jgi:hypothetical protein
MPAVIRSVLELHEGCRSPQAALLVAQMHDMHRRLHDATRGLAPPDLSWQQAPGLNTIGMLLTHIAVSEVHLTQIGVLGEKEGHVADVIGIDADGDGMPMPADGSPPAALAGRDLAYFDGLLERSLAYVTAAASRLADADLDRSFERARPDGATRVLNVRWVLHHIVEHAAGHFGQILLVRRQCGKEPPRL